MRSCRRGPYTQPMSMSLAPPADLRPAQLGIVMLGRVILGHIAATLLDLAQRGFLRIDEIPGDDDHDWLLTDLRGPAATGSGLLRFEAALLDGIFARQYPARLGEISGDLIPALNQVRTQLYRDAVRRGWLRRWQHGRRTPRGEQLLKQIQSFRRELRALAAAGDSVAMAHLAPYVIVLGLGMPPALRLNADDTETAHRRQPEIQWSHCDRFATSWLAVCEGFPHGAAGQGHHGHEGRSGDFVQQWSAPREHGYSSHGHGHSPVHGGHGGGHGDFGGAYDASAHFGGGGHGL